MKTEMAQIQSENKNLKVFLSVSRLGLNSFKIYLKHHNPNNQHPK